MSSALDIAKRALDRGFRLGADLEVYFQEGRTTSIKVYGGEVESVAMSEPRGLGVRAARNGQRARCCLAFKFVCEVAAEPRKKSWAGVRHYRNEGGTACD